LPKLHRKYSADQLVRKEILTDNEMRQMIFVLTAGTQ